MDNTGQERGRIVSQVASITNEFLSREESDSQDQLQLAELIRDVGLALIQSTNLSEMAQQCAQSLVNHFDAAFARIWTLNEQTQVLELQASAGIYTHLNGPHSRVPVGAFKIGLIASERLPHLTNDVMHDPRVNNQEWAQQEGMVAFAGYPLLVSNRVTGVMALFARHALSPSVLDAMASVANTIAVGLSRKQAEQERIALLQSERQARQAAEVARERTIDILEHLTDGFMIFDHEWHYRYINPQAVPFAGKPVEDLLGKKVWEVFPNLVGSIYYQQYHYAVEKQQPVNFRLFSILLDNWFDIRAYPIVDGLAVYFRKITDEVRQEEERTRLLEATLQAQAETEAALAIRTTFLSSVSHDLKTPLAAIKANAQLVQRRMKRDAALESAWLTDRLDGIERATAKMTGMIDDLLSLTRLQQGQASEEEGFQLDFLLLVKSAIIEQQTTSKRHQITLTVHDEPFLVKGNATRLDRMLTNLLGNAIKYSPGGGEIMVMLTKEQTDEAVLHITDSGVGIPAADLPLIFERFHRASNVLGQIQGTGIGLASVVQVVEQHHGKIAVTSEEGRGSTFTIRLPLLVGNKTQSNAE